MQNEPSEAVREDNYIVAAKAFQAKHLGYLNSDDLDGLVANCYTSDARIHTFQYRVSGTQNVKQLIAQVSARLQRFETREVTFFTAGKDFIWQELNLVRGDEHVEIYEFKFLRDGKVFLQLMGEKRGTLGLPVNASDSFADDLSEADSNAAQELHHRYIDYQSRGDADGMADDFFTPDARLITSQLKLEGREELRSFFATKFAKESGFHLVSIRNIAGDVDYVWFEATAASSGGGRTVYDVMLLREGQVSMQLVGMLDGELPAHNS